MTGTTHGELKEGRAGGLRRVWKFQVRAPGVTPDHPDEMLGEHLTQGGDGQLSIAHVFVGVQLANIPFS